MDNVKLSLRHLLADLGDASRFESVGQLATVLPGRAALGDLRKLVATTEKPKKRTKQR